nr:alpha/beta hydrolase-fold protein [Entomospira nematocera]
MISLFTSSLYAQSIHTNQLYSDHLGKPWRYSIYLPELIKENTSQSYPVIFLLHGMFNSDKSFLHKGFAKIINELIDKQLIEPVIVVFPHGFQHSWWIDSDKFGAIQQSFFEDLLPHINHTYPVSLNSHQRALAGISMGGFGALNYIFDSRANFDHLALFSPALFLDSPLNLQTHPHAAPINWRHHHVIKNTLEQRAFAIAEQEQSFNALRFIPHTYPYLHQRFPQRLNEVNIFLFYGDSDPITDSGTRFFQDFLQEHHISATITVTQGAKHSWSLWKTDFARTLQYLFPKNK